MPNITYESRVSSTPCPAERNGMNDAEGRIGRSRNAEIRRMKDADGRQENIFGM